MDNKPDEQDSRKPEDPSNCSSSSFNAPRSRRGSKNKLLQSFRNFSSTSAGKGSFSDKGSLEDEAFELSGGTSLSLSSRSYSGSSKSPSRLASTNSNDSGVFIGGSKTKFRVLFIGPGGVGKTSLIHQFIQKPALKHTKSTIQELYNVTVELQKTHTVILTIEDTGGCFLEEFPGEAEISLNMTEGLVMVFALNDPESFEKIASMREKVIER